MKIFISLVISIVLTIIVAYFFFLPPHIPPDYVYVIILLIFFAISYLILNMIKRRKVNHANPKEK